MFDFKETKDQVKKCKCKGNRNKLHGKCKLENYSYTLRCFKSKKAHKLFW